MRRSVRIFIGLGFTLGLLFLLAIAIQGPATAAMIGSGPKAPTATTVITVTTLVDEDDGGGHCAPASGEDCSLREAIDHANANSTSADPYEIHFAQGGIISVTQGYFYIPGDGVIINGDRDADGNPDIEVRYISGNIPTNSGLFYLNASDIHLQGLAVVGSTESGIFITNYDDPDSLDIEGIEVANNWVGINLQGEIVSNTVYGIRVVKYPPGGSRSVNNILIQENVLSGNGDDGLYLQDVPSATHVLSNIIGLDPTGTVTSPNGGDGISIIARGIPTTATTIRGNTISGNARHGIFLDEAQGIMIARNKIGTNITGTQGLGNGKDGIQVNDSDHNVIGGSDPASRNIIAGNARAGVFVSGADAQHNLIQNNYIGTGQSGTEVVGNGESGDSINDDGDGGVYIQDGATYNDVRDNLIRFNYIGVRFSGGEPLPADPIDPPQHNQVISNTITQNNKYGITNKSTHRNTAPYTTPAAGDNLIQGNVITGTGQACGASDTWCTGIGIYNYGASPQISNNRIEENEDYGISNSVHFWTDGASNASDDLLSMPIKTAVFDLEIQRP